MNNTTVPDPDTGAGPIGEAEAEEHVSGICFKHGPPRRVGIELEWLVHDAHDPARPVAPDRLTAALAAAGTRPLSGAMTLEPGGQWELSSAPGESLGRCLDETERDLDRMRAAAAAAGLRLVGYGTEPDLPPERTLHLPRYAAMEEFFDRSGRWGRVMMCSSASVQVNLDAGLAPGGPLGQRERWDLLHGLAPVLVAAFANSPLLRGRPTGWRSTRQAVWARLDAGRTLAPALPARAAGTGADGAGLTDLRTAWTDYVLNAHVLCIRRPDGPWTVPRGLTFRDWLRAAGPDRPTRADLDYHLSTLFPPVRPRGHFELRVVDAQQGDAWQVVAALVTALLDDPAAADAARAALEPLRALGEPGTAQPGSATAADTGPRSPLWLRAARLGLSDPDLQAAAETCFDLALAALPRLAAPARATESVAEFAERYVRRGRCPADDFLETRTGTEARTGSDGRTGPTHVVAWPTRADRTEQADRVEPADYADHAGRSDRLAPADRADHADHADRSDRLDPVDRSVHADRSEQADRTAGSDRAARPEPRRAEEISWS